MIGKIFAIVSGIGLLIAIFLFVSNPSGSASIINAIGGNAIKGISTLQGRYTPADGAKS